MYVAICSLWAYHPGMTIMTSRFLRRSAVLVIGTLMSVPVSAQEVTKKDVAGISTFAQIETTIACGGSTTLAAIPAIKDMGFKSVINVRLASEEGALVKEEGAVVRAAGMNYVHLPFNMRSPDSMLIDNFVEAVSAPANTPAYVHCAAGGRAAALWMIKRVKADGWTEARALKEANALGLNDRLRPFALDYLRTHP
jgi:uncharacterized protein (TIGR01244 family)